MEVAAAQLLPQDLDDAAIWATSQVLALASGAATTPPLSDCASLYSAATATTQSPTPPPADQTTKRRRSVLKIEMPEFPSVLEKRMRGGPGRKRKGISEEEKQARQQERVLRNRISAQESRNKKRAYMDLLENAATDIQDENERLRDDNERLSKRVRTLESENSQLNTKIDWLMQQMAEMKQRQDSFELQRQPASSLPLTPISLPSTTTTTSTTTTATTAPPFSLQPQPQSLSFPHAYFPDTDAEKYVLASTSPLSTLPSQDTTTISLPLSELTQLLFDGFSEPAAPGKLVDLSANSQQRRPSLKVPSARHSILLTQCTLQQRLSVQRVSALLSALMTQLLPLYLILSSSSAACRSPTRCYDLAMRLLSGAVVDVPSTRRPNCTYSVNDSDDKLWPNWQSAFRTDISFSSSSPAQDDVRVRVSLPLYQSLKRQLAQRATMRWRGLQLFSDPP